MVWKWQYQIWSMKGPQNTWPFLIQMHRQRSWGGRPTPLDFVRHQQPQTIQVISWPSSQITSARVGLKKAETNKHGSSYHKPGIFYHQRVTLKACNQVLHTFSLLLNTSKQYCKPPPNFLSQLSKKSSIFLEMFQIRFCICEIHMLNMKSLKIYFRFYEVLSIQ